jgi:DNA replication and repair protein RecF
VSDPARGESDVYLQTLTLRNFRNYRSLDLHFEPSGNLFLGGNAQGKTNLIEAIHCLTTARSQRGASEEELIRQGCEFYLLKGEGVVEEHRVVNIEIRSLREGGRQLQINGNVHKKVSDLLGLLSIVDFSPEDVNIVGGSPHHRRRFMNFCLCQLSSSYWLSLTEYNRVLQQRNVALRSRSSRRWRAADDDELSAWDEQLIQLGTRLIGKRVEFLQWLNPEVDRFHQEITAGDEHLELIYEPAVELSPGNEEIQDHFRTALERVRERENRLGMTLVGPHRDEVLLTVNQRNIRAFGSQGQQRTAAIALKLAAARLLENKGGEQPILLLDDVFAELDVDRTRSLFEQFNGFGQLFIATAKEGDLAGCGRHLKRTMISGGTATPV